MNFFHIFLTPVVLTFLLLSCNDSNYPNDVWDVNDLGKPAPKINNIFPTDSAFSGSDEVTIEGLNFHKSKDSIFVYFNKVLAEVLTTSETSIVVISPNIVSDSVSIKVSVQGAFNFAEYSKNYILYPRMIKYGDFDALDESVWGLELDKNEILYVGRSVFPEGAIDQVLPPEGIRNKSLVDAILPTPLSMKIGTDQKIYYVDGVNPYIVRHDLNTGTPQFSILPGIASDLDFDQHGNLYAGGSGQSLYRIKQDLSSTIVADYDGISIYSVRVYDSYVYVAGIYSGEDINVPEIGIWKNKILSEDGSLDTKKVVLDWKKLSNGNSSITSISFDENGMLYIASDGNIGIATYTTDGTFKKLYPKIILPPIAKMSWGSSNYLYLNYRGEPRAIYRLELSQKGVPYFGRQY